MEGHDSTPDHCPTCAGSTAVETFTGRMTTAAASSARTTTTRFMRISDTRRRTTNYWEQTELSKGGLTPVPLLQSRGPDREFTDAKLRPGRMNYESQSPNARSSSCH